MLNRLTEGNTHPTWGLKRVESIPFIFTYAISRFGLTSVGKLIMSPKGATNTTTEKPRMCFLSLSKVVLLRLNTINFVG